MLKPLNEELARWADSGQKVRVWWRDDDAQQSGSRLEKLLQISYRHKAPLALAVVPRGARLSLAEKVADHEQVCALQHGFAHRNYAPAGVRKMELGWHRPRATILDELSKGCHRLQTLFGEQFVPVMVPPWNRIDRRVTAMLGRAGLHGLSTLGARGEEYAVEHIYQVNVHVDIIDWKGGASFAGEERCIRQMVEHLAAKRTGHADLMEPTGVMSHHRVHDEACWRFLDRLFEFLASRPEVSLPRIESIFRPVNVAS